MTDESKEQFDPKNVFDRNAFTGFFENCMGMSDAFDCKRYVTKSTKYFAQYILSELNKIELPTNNILMIFFGNMVTEEDPKMETNE